VETRDPGTATPRRAGWDFTLMMLTVGLLGALGLQSLLGTVYAWWGYRTQPDFEQVAYPGFIAVMNAVAAPIVIALVLVMGLCVPKRLFARRTLAAVSAGMVALGVLVWALTGSLAHGLAAYLVAAALIQVAVVVLTIAGARGLSYLSGTRIAKAGSGLLHLGFVLFVIVVVALRDSAWMLPVFYLSAVLLTGGSAAAFYARPAAGGTDTDPDARSSGA
jgi:hypothetical protein